MRVFAEDNEVDFHKEVSIKPEKNGSFVCYEKTIGLYLDDMMMHDTNLFSGLGCFSGQIK